MSEDILHVHNTQVTGSRGAVPLNESEYAQKMAATIARYVVSFLLMRGIHETCVLLYNAHNSQKRPDIAKMVQDNRRPLVFFASIVFGLVFLKESVLVAELPLLFIGYIIAQYILMEQPKPPTINYGVGMACSLFEGYLTHVIPSDGAKFVGFEENINIFEARQGVCFPVKRLFIVIPNAKSLYCPPDLKNCNMPNRDDLPYLEAIQSLEDVMKDVAGVKNRMYRNSAYKINRAGRPPVYLAAEFATPLHTLHKVLDKRFIYDKLCDVNVEELVEDFCSQLAKTIERSPDCRGKCELVHYDARSQNLADVLLDKIRELEPNFEEIISRNNELMKTDMPATGDKNQSQLNKDVMTHNLVNKPERPMSAYMLWLNSAREQIKADNPGKRVTDIAKIGGEMWRGMKDKSAWEEKAARAKEQYEKELEAFYANGGKEDGRE